MLKVTRVTKNFGGLTAVNDISFDLAPAGITGLIGPNGSGKTTLFHLISGFYRLDRGAIYFQGRLISRRQPHLISRMGLSRTFQHTRVLPFLSVLANLLAAPQDQSGEKLWAVFLRPGRIRREEERQRAKAERLLELLQLDHLTHELAGHLSFGQQKLLELGRLLMCDPSLILLDEPTAGINPTLIRQIVRVLRELCAQGIKIFMIEHNIPLVAEICQDVLVMDSGSLIFAGPPAAARRHPQVIEAYLGRADGAA